MTAIVSPIDALHRPGQSLRTVRRTIQQIDNPAGLYAALPQSDVPVGEHALDFLFLTDDEIEAFWVFYDRIVGALLPFWVPSFQTDFALLAPIGPTDTTFDIQSIRYTDLLFPDPNRVDLAFVRADNTFLKRTITAAVDHGDGTETLTLNAALGETWTPTPANGVCFCWYVRMKDDVAQVAYDTHSAGACAMGVVEDKEPPSGSGTSEEMP